MLVIDDARTWPQHVKELLLRPTTQQVLMAHNSMEHATRLLHMQEIIETVEHYASEVGIAGFHCTKQGLGVDFAETGLRVLNMEQHHSEVVAKIRDGALLSPELILKFEQRLDHWRRSYEGKREGMTWFCFSRKLALSSGTSDFFRYFGGEAVAFAFLRKGEFDVNIREWLATVGEPVIVEARLQPKQLTFYTGSPIGKSLVSHYALTVNPGFYIYEVEGHTKSDIVSSDIVAVHAHADLTRTA